MPVTLVTTVGAANANAYCSLAEADAYHEGHAHASTWTGTDDVKNRAIVTATRLLDESYDWFGWVVDDVQALGWPRRGAYYKTGYAVPDTVVPQAVKNATAEFARQLLAEDRTADSEVEAQGITGIKAGSVELTFDTATAKSQVVPDAVHSMLKFYGRRVSGSPVTAQVIR